MSGGARIEARGWGWRHAGRRLPAVAELDLRIEPGERLLLLGPSGAGKSTLLAALAGVLGGADEGEESGELRLDGAHPATLRGVAGLVMQDPQANTILTRIGDDVAFGCENLAVPRAEIWRRVPEALAAVGLRLPLDRSTARLSGGERQRLALAGVLALRPRLLLLDEPTANLDPQGVIEVRDAVDRVARATGATFVVIEHRVETWLPVVDRIVVLDPAGGLAADGPPERVLGEHGRRLAEQGVWVPGHPPHLERPPLVADVVSAGRRGLVGEPLPSAGSSEPPSGAVAPGRDPVSAAAAADTGAVLFGPESPRTFGSESGQVLLQARALSIGRAGEALHSELDFTLRAGQSTVLLGPNGAGKTTLAFTLAGLLPPLAGEVLAAPALADGAGPHPHRWRSRQLLRRIGTVFQQPEHQFVAATVRRELEVGPHAAGRSAADTARVVDELLAALRLERLAEANPFTLSGGERRRLSVATVLATAPRVVVLDEPTFGQDRVTWQQLVAILARLVAEGSAVLSVTHDQELVRVLGDQVIELPAAQGQTDAGQADEELAS